MTLENYDIRATNGHTRNWAYLWSQVANLRNVVLVLVTSSTLSCPAVAQTVPERIPTREHLGHLRIIGTDTALASVIRSGGGPAMVSINLVTGDTVQAPVHITKATSGVEDIFPAFSVGYLVIASGSDTNRGSWLLADSVGREKASASIESAEFWHGSAACRLDGVSWGEFARTESGWWLYLFNVTEKDGTVPRITNARFRIPYFATILGFVASDEYLGLELRLPTTRDGKYTSITRYKLDNVHRCANKADSFTVDTSGAWIREIVLSPDGKRLCWLTTEPTDSIGNRFGGYPGTTATIFTTDARGGSKLRVARIDVPNVRPATLESSGSEPAVPSNVAWSADGTKLYFVKDEELYSVGAPSR